MVCCHINKMILIISCELHDVITSMTICFHVTSYSLRYDHMLTQNHMLHRLLVMFRVFLENCDIQMLAFPPKN